MKNQRFKAGYSSDMDALMIYISSEQFRGYRLVKIVESKSGAFYAIMEEHYD